MKGEGKNERLHLTMSSQSMARLAALKEKTEATSYAEVFKSALRLYEAFIEEAEKGNDVMTRNPSGELTAYKVFLP